MADESIYEQMVPYLGLGMTGLGGLYEAKEMLRTSGAKSRQRLKNAALYRQNALQESINASARDQGIRRGYKRVKDRIKTTFAGAGFRPSGELQREARLNEDRAIEESRYGSAMMARNAALAAKREVEQARLDMLAGKYAARASQFDTGAAMLGMYLDSRDRRKY